ncbi:uncharacterized protein CcaverHIS019_0701630 [Cutaneotrichosporon cavernicola]|uniref:Uncharacterized protein n=1 Tax=Cutaneotrichosporon cavernicola TaxID=279322 RepID=A0AA48QYP3_9TREE|nr:uncharacterized protein CcaverHIS019_0701630 [Cutaneotrichosporon cavernicola]BEI94591.1 hypothetical protein CcaverHIS019_0701630 [Cutaneotrichosporon cavernicola]
MSIPFPTVIVKQLPHTRYRLLEQLENEFGGIPLPPSQEAMEEALELADVAIKSPVFSAEDQEEARKWKEALMENADDWTRIRDPFNPLYRVLVQMQDEIQTLRHELRRAQTRLDTYDEARINQARRLVGLPPARPMGNGMGGISGIASGMATPPIGSARFASPAIINRLSADSLRDALETYLNETPPFEASRDSMQRALKVCCGMEESDSTVMGIWSNGDEPSANVISVVAEKQIFMSYPAQLDEEELLMVADGSRSGHTSDEIY